MPGVVRREKADRGLCQVTVVSQRVIAADEDFPIAIFTGSPWLGHT